MAPSERPHPAQAVNYTRAVASGDFNNDGNSDLVVSGDA